MLGRGFSSPSLKELALPEDAQLIFLIFRTFVRPVIFFPQTVSTQPQTVQTGILKYNSGT